MYNLNFDIWKFGHPQCANSANGALSSFNISNNGLTQGEPDGTDKFGFPKYKTDMSGVIALAEWLKK